MQLFLDNLKAFFETISGWVWGPIMLMLLVGTGILLTVLLKGLQFTMLGYALKQAFVPSKKHEDGEDHEGDISHFAALMTALSATIGTGNIAGVATAVVTGGPGAVFWMWMTAIFGMATKYGEGVLAVKYRVTNSKGEMSGGPMYYIEKGLGKNWKWMAVAFALFGTFASFGIGSSVQSNSVAQAVQTSFGVEPAYTGVILTVLTAIVLLGGIKGIAKAASFIVPAMAVFYVVGGLAIIVINSDVLMPAVKLIFSDAFSAQAVAGGAIGTVIRYGVARGVFSNEAGMGSAPNAAAAAEVKHPVSQGMIQMLGVFVDTIIVCSCTAFIVLTYQQPYGDLSGAALTQAAIVSQVGEWGAGFLAAILFMFAFSTVIGNYAYAESNVQFIKSHWLVTAVFRMLVLAWVYFGAIANVPLVWDMADMAMGIMAWINLVAILLLSPLAFLLLKDYTAKLKMGKDPEFKLSEHPGLKRKIKSDIW